MATDQSETTFDETGETVADPPGIDHLTVVPENASESS